MIVRVLCRLIASPEDFGEELSEHVGKQEADCVCSLRGESASQRAGDIVELAGDVPDLPPGAFVHRSHVVEHTGDGGGGDACLPGDITYGSHDPAALSQSSMVCLSKGNRSSKCKRLHPGNKKTGPHTIPHVNGYKVSPSRTNVKRKSEKICASGRIRSQPYARISPALFRQRLNKRDHQIVPLFT